MKIMSALFRQRTNGCARKHSKQIMLLAPVLLSGFSMISAFSLGRPRISPAAVVKIKRGTMKRALAPPIRTAARNAQSYKPQSPSILSSIKGDEINFEESGFSFEIDSFDKKGTWLTIEWDKKDIPTRQKEVYEISQSDSDVRISCFSPEEPSPVQLSLIRDRLVFVKRDDLLHLHKSNVSGNKARKMFALNELDMEEFPDAIVSYGGPQSNAMLALAAIVNSRNVELAELEANRRGHGSKTSKDDAIINDVRDEIESDSWFHNDDSDVDVDAAVAVDALGDKAVYDGVDEDDDLSEFESSLHVLPKDLKKRFVYYTKKLPRYLRKQPNGNLLRALSLGMEIVEVSNEEYNKMFAGEDGGHASAPKEIDPPVPMKSLWIPQGGFCGVATQGAKLMADEIVSFWIEKGNGMPLTVCLPGGTCTTAMCVSKEINALVEKIARKEGQQNVDIKVAVIPCVGDAAYAERQMKALDASEGGNSKDDIPEIFKPWKNIYPRFGEPLLPILNTFMEMKDEHGIYVDLLYGAPAWNLLLRYLTSQRESPIKGRQVMYVHSGGLEGVSSQLTRYKHKGLIVNEAIQG